MAVGLGDDGGSGTRARLAPRSMSYRDDRYIFIHVIGSRACQSGAL